MLDKWIMARLEQLVGEVTENLDKYDTMRAGRPIQVFIDDLSTWYLRRSRDRFKNDNVGLKWSHTKYGDKEIDEFADKLRKFV